MGNNVLTSYSHEELTLAGCSAVPLMTVSVQQPPANESAAIRFSIESFLGIVVAALLLVGLGSGVYKKINHDEAADAYRQGERNIANHDLSGALKDYTAAIKSNHRYYDAYCRRAEVYAELGDNRDAENDVKQAISIHPLWPFALDLQRQFAHFKGNGPWTPVSDSFDLKPVIN